MIGKIRYAGSRFFHGRVHGVRSFCCMKYIVIIGLLALLIGLLSSLGVYWVLGEQWGFFFAKIIAAPVGIAGAVVMFLVFDHVWPKK